MYHVHPHLAEIYVTDRLDEIRKSAGLSHRRRQGRQRQRPRWRG